MTTSTDECTTPAALKGHRVALVGKLAGMGRREAQQMLRSHGATVVDQPDPATTLLVVGEHELPLSDTFEETLDDAVRAAVERGTLEIVSETQLWQRLGQVDGPQHIHSLYTPAMLARLLGVGVSTIRRWQRRGWIKPVREVRRLAYFDFQEVATARRLTELLAAGMSPGTIEKKLSALARYLPGIDRPLAQLSIIVEGKQLLARQGDGLVDAAGQLRFDFGPISPDGVPAAHLPLAQADILVFVQLGAQAPATPAEMLQMAGQLEDDGQLPAAAEMYRATMAAGGSSAEICFLLAELLYQMHDLSAARERYYMAIELDEDYVEARANLGCLLAELGEKELAISALTGTLTYHEDYSDVHYHLARLLDETGRESEAVEHWEAFLRLAPMSPWADDARERLAHITS